MVASTFYRIQRQSLAATVEICKSQCEVILRQRGSPAMELNMVRSQHSLPMSPSFRLLPSISSFAQQLGFFGLVVCSFISESCSQAFRQMLLMQGLPLPAHLQARIPRCQPCDMYEHTQIISTSRSRSTEILGRQIRYLREWHGMASFWERLVMAYGTILDGCWGRGCGKPRGNWKCLQTVHVHCAYCA